MRRLLALLLLAGCASAPPASFRVLTYNIHAGKDAGGVDNLQRVADIITSNEADVVLLQEVDRGTKRSGNVDQLTELTTRTKLNGVFGKSLDYQGGDYGIAVLSRWPVKSHETIPLPDNPPQPRAGGSVEPRVALAVEIDAPFGTLHVVNTHIDASREDTWRLQEAAHFVDAVAKRRNGVILAGGDLNSEPDSAVQKNVRAGGLRDLWTDCGSGDSLTYPAATPVKRIDYVYAIAKARCTSARVLETEASDHRPVLFTMTSP
jgi:endonuclease/exonuclease/phosphatase family metal-dependent hydrolase